ncbi:NAD(P)-dependent malic enzyme [Erysipelothrix aquatica]|uniref:NAD(P)-dependent malic enzyme n=1 Tax=Erysipelothrix aquatica TaxID=2683714 RepID=UPI00135B17E7|nr:NADP-dependent malic enzyme [Erysipelothrix aquatica]
MSRALNLHANLQGKLTIEAKYNIDTADDLALVYSPGVADPCLEIKADVTQAYTYTWKQNTVAVISDGSAVLGLGNIGPEAALPVMEGKAILLKRFANINAVPIVLNTQDTEMIIEVCKAIASGFGAINLEDIAAPRCIEIEQRLEEELTIPVFHDDQHGTAIVTLAALMNALKLVNKSVETIKVVVSGTGAAGSAIIKLLKEYGVKSIHAFDLHGIVASNTATTEHQKMIAALTENQDNVLSMDEALVNADVFIGVSAGNIIKSSMINRMAKHAIVFAMANPIPEISYEDALAAGASVVGTGRSDYPNQINNVLVFPGLFKGLLEVKATSVPQSVHLAAAKAIAECIDEIDLSATNIVPSVFDPRVVDNVANAVTTTVKTLRAKGAKI